MLLRTSRSDAPSIAASAAIAITIMMIARRGESTTAWAILAASATAAIIFIAPRVMLLASREADSATVDVSPWGIRHSDAAGLHESVAWGDLSEVAVITTTDPEHDEDMFFVLRGRNGNRVVIPHILAVESGVIASLRSKLSQFDDDAFADAIASHHDSMFVLWRGDESAAAVPALAPPDRELTLAKAG